MDVFDLNSVKAEKAAAMLRFRRLRRIAKLFRFVELGVALVLLSWLSSRVPFAVKASGEYLRQLSGVLVSPFFVFLVGNAIVVTLVAKSGQFARTTKNAAENEFYQNLRSEASDEVLEPKETVFEDKEIICEEHSTSTAPKPEDDLSVFPSGVKNVVSSEVKLEYKRTQSENLARKRDEMKPSEKLRRSETDIVSCRKMMNYGDESEEEKARPEDGLSNDEFRRIIEAFIAKQVKFHREESKAVVLHGQA
ncbi:hypothetical protein Ancab_003251 [Ancistrocladus abbreviatus]